MAAIRPFQGLRYDLGRAGDAASLLAPPYDVIDDDGRAQLAAASRYNCVHVILPEGEGDAKYSEGARRFRALIETALVRDGRPAIYVYHQTFASQGKTYVRKGFICTIELTRFGAGPVLAHERTLAGPKADRLALMRACNAHLELVFGMFSDPEKRWELAVLDHMRAPVLACHFDDVEHSLWRVDDPQALAAVVELLAGKSIYIADGHHRYETMCAYRDELERAGAGETAKYGLIYLSNLKDDGLVVLPTHRLVHDLPTCDIDKLLQGAARFFDQRDVVMPRDEAELSAVLGEAGKDRAAIGLAAPRSGRLHVLTLREDFDPSAVGLGSLPLALVKLDVLVLHELLLERGLGITKEMQSAKTNIHYYKSTQAALEVASRGNQDVQLVCFMNATPVSAVVEVCDSGEVMPQKSTFFFPKIPTGLVFHDLSSGAESR